MHMRLSDLLELKVKLLSKRLVRLAGLASLLPALSVAAPITLTGTVRDFNSSNTSFNGVAGHPDFESYLGDDRGIVMTQLGADGKPVYESANANPTITSAASFYQWYHDDPNVNRTGAISITLNPITATTYQFSSNAFFPINGQLLGQNTLGRNFGFTTEFHTQFTYLAANNDLFSFSGDDDVFVFVNGVLAIDLGGVHPAESRSINLNTFAAANGLLNGQNYTLDVFQAERHTSGSNFEMTTSLQLLTASNGVPEPGSIGMTGLALLGLAASRRGR